MTYTLSWDSATDKVTPSTQIVYGIYQAPKSGGEDFSSPTYTVRHGVTSFTTPVDKKTPIWSSAKA